VRVALRLGFGEVEAGLCTRAAAGDVAPLLEGAVVGEEDEGALDGAALGGVAREGVAVFQVVGRIRERDEASRALCEA
jgi:hypothetical protein